MSKKKTKLAPKLRFAEFYSTGEWEKHKLEEIADRITEKVGKRKLTTLSISAGVGFVSQTEKFSRDISGNQYANYIYLKKGDFSYNKGNSKKFPQGCIYELKEFEEGAAPNAFLSFRFKEGYIPSFYKGYFDNNFHGKQLLRFITSGARMDGLLNINPSDFFGIYLPTPKEKEEQQKISDCLSYLDDLIAAEDKKLETLKEHKKGLMQKLFPAEGKTVPEWRFSEFRDSGEWEKKLVENFFIVGSSKRILQEDWTTHGVPFYRTRELVSLSKKEPFSNEIFISEELFSDVSEKYGIPSEGDFLISGVGTLGISYQVQAGDKFYYKDGNVLWFKLKEGLYSTYFKYCFESDYIQKQIRMQTDSSTVGTYTIQNAKRTKLWCPPSYKEQEKIADCLSALDNLLAAQLERINALHSHKKGLMQGLFPSVEEVGE